MALLTIGAFAKASRLSAKALRLYDELGLLRPAHVDPDSGYRYYDPGQLERARLVAWLRRIGNGELFQVTHDHSVVQSLIDEGRLTPEEARSHPQRAILLRALTGKDAVEADVSLRDARDGDRYLLCSDGLSAVVSTERLHATLAAGTDPEETAQRLVDLAYAAGGPDNVTCIVADVVAMSRTGQEVSEVVG